MPCLGNSPDAALLQRQLSIAFPALRAMSSGAPGMIPLRRLIAVAALAIACSGFAQSDRSVSEETRVPKVKYHLRILGNGLKIYSVVDRRTTNVALQVWYGVGARNDPARRSGFAHLFEHLMFKGTREMPPE